MNLNRRVHPSSPQTSKAVSPPQLNPSNKENAMAIPPRPDYTNLRRPSAGWLAEPAYIDGGLDPPVFYYSREDMINTLLLWNPQHHWFTQPPPAPAPSVFATGDVGVNLPASQQLSAPTPDQQQAALSSFSLRQEEEEEDPATALVDAGLQVNVLVVYSAPDKITTRGARAVLKKQKDLKFGMFDVANLDRCSFIQSTLGIHSFGPQYSPGVHSGPPFKISWTGSPGGKTGAVTIDTDQEWALAVAALQRKTGAKPAVLVEYNLDDMDGYRVMSKRSGIYFSPSLSVDISPSSSRSSSPCPLRPQPHNQEDASDDPELLYGTKVPRVDQFTPQDQVNGMMIVQLKARWPCEAHHGENGDIGYCYVDATGRHIGLNMRKFKTWAAAMAAGDATKHEPPNIEEFDGARDGRLSNTRPRGRAGPRSSEASSSSSNELLMAALIANLTPRTVAPPPASFELPTTPPRTASSVLPTTPRKAQPLSPIPTTSSELHSCLNDFLKAKSIDILACESALANLELTPAIIADVPVSRLCEITGVVEGRLWSFQNYCREWCARLAEKKRRALLL
ncbi:hypothetical protein C8R43DRAFT_1140426 [Mycena crocata]|nr:hypothetical protein C8R43DRAFT_1140426 [Mycena crocata]